MLYELSDSIIKNINIIIDNAEIKGSQAVAILQIKQALTNPVKPEEKKPEEKKDKSAK